MPIKYNPFTGKYEYAEEDQEPTWNEYEGAYEFGRPEETAYTPFTRRYSKRGRAWWTNGTPTATAMRPCPRIGS